MSLGEAIVIPFRSFETCKSRLAVSLDVAEARRLAKGMFEHVLRTVIGSRAAETVLVVTATEEVAGFARTKGAAVLVEQTGDLNPALEQALETLRGGACRRATIIAADLPFLCESDVRLLSMASSGAIAIAPNRAGTGTNGLSIPTDLGYRMCFGEESAQAHLEQSLQLTPRPFLIHARGLATDIDTLEDLAWALGTCPEKNWSASADDIKDVFKLYWKRWSLSQNDLAGHKPHFIQQES